MTSAIDIVEVALNSKDTAFWERSDLDSWNSNCGRGHGYDGCFVPALNPLGTKPKYIYILKKNRDFKGAKYVLNRHDLR